MPASLVVFGAITLASVLISLLSLFTGKPAPLQVFQDKIGLVGLNGGLFFLILLFWVVLFLLLFIGLFGTIYALLNEPIQLIGEDEKTWAWRFSVLKLASHTAVLGVVAALPFTLIRLSLSRQQVDTALEALTNEKMNTVVDDLHAQRQITEHLEIMFGNRFVKLHDGKLPDGVENHPKHWPETKLKWTDFNTQWRKWQHEQCSAPDNRT